MDIYLDKQGNKYIGIEINKSNDYTYVHHSTMVQVKTGQIVSMPTAWFTYIGKIENGIFTPIEDVRKILS